MNHNHNHGTSGGMTMGMNGTTDPNMEMDPHGMMGMDPHMHMNHSGAGHSMQMFFHTGVSEYILFEQLLTSNAGEMVGACVVIFFLAVLYEGLKVMREQLLKSAFSSSMKYREVTISSQTSQDNIVIDSKTNGSVDKMNTNHHPDLTFQKPKGFRMLSSSHFIQTALHVIQVFVSYCLMLVFMTYNVWLCLSVVLGAGAGYFLFGWKRAVVVDVNEHCH